MFKGICLIFSMMIYSPMYLHKSDVNVIHVHWGKLDKLVQQDTSNIQLVNSRVQNALLEFHADVVLFRDTASKDIAKKKSEGISAGTINEFTRLFCVLQCSISIMNTMLAKYDNVDLKQNLVLTAKQVQDNLIDYMQILIEQESVQKINASNENGESVETGDESSTEVSAAHYNGDDLDPEDGSVYVQDPRSVATTPAKPSKKEKR